MVANKQENGPMPGNWLLSWYRVQVKYNGALVADTMNAVSGVGALYARVNASNQRNNSWDVIITGPVGTAWSYETGNSAFSGN